MKKLTPMEQHFINFYNWKRTKFSFKFHRTLDPHCKMCKSEDECFKKLTEMDVKVK